MIETNPGPGAGVLIAYWLFSKDKMTKHSAPGALIIHALGGIHEISFPYVLMNPMLLLATIGGSVSALFYYSLLDLGLSGPPSPGSLISYLAMAPKGSTLSVIIGIFIAAGVSFLIASPIIRMSGAKSSDSLAEAQQKMKDMKAQSKGMATSSAAEAPAVNMKEIKSIVFACDAGMGSSAMGAAVLQKRLKKAGLTDIKVSHASVSEVPKDAQLVVCHQDLADRAKASAPQARLITITNFMAAPEYATLVEELASTQLPSS